MNQANAGEPALTLPRHLAVKPLIHTTIDICSGDHRIGTPRARIVIARNPAKKPSYQSKRTSNRYLLHRLLNSVVARGDRRWNLAYSGTGAPVLANCQPGNISISLARTGDWLAAGVAFDAAIGIDIEQMRARANYRDTAEFLNWKVTVADLQGFYEKWTLWEAGAKCVDGSVLMDSNQAFEQLCSIDIDNRVGSSGQWHGLQICLADEISCAVVLRCETGLDLSHQLIDKDKTATWPLIVKAAIDPDQDRAYSCA